MITPPEWVARRSLSIIERALQDTRVVVLNGARQTGKSTLARRIAARHPGAVVRYLDDASVRASAEADSAAFVHHDGLLVIDEAQRVPELMLAIKHQVDLDPKPGQFLLTGSAQLFARSATVDALAGRSETIELWPLSQGEIEGSAERFIDAVFEEGADLVVPPSSLRRQDYVERALRGGYPEAVRRTDPRRRARFFESYIEDLIHHDVRQLSEIERPADMRRLVNVAGARSASLLVPAAIGNELRLPASTVKRYLDLLELLFLVRKVPAWSANMTTRAVATPKLLLVDSGLACHLAGFTMQRARHPSAPVGAMLENLVLGELARQLDWAEEPVRLYHYRDRDQYEVDAVLERATGEIVAIEVKAAETVRAEDFRGIQNLARRVGDRLLAGLVLYAGRQALPFGPRLLAAPIASLWSTGTTPAPLPS